MIVKMLATIALALLIAGCGRSNDGESDYGRYTDYCHKLNGWMTMTHGATWSENAKFQCIGPSGPLMPEISY